MLLHKQGGPRLLPGNTAQSPQLCRKPHVGKYTQRMLSAGSPLRHLLPVGRKAISASPEQSLTRGLSVVKAKQRQGSRKSAPWSEHAVVTWVKQRSTGSSSLALGEARLQFWQLSSSPALAHHASEIPRTEQVLPLPFAPLLLRM